MATITLAWSLTLLLVGTSLACELTPPPPFTEAKSPGDNFYRLVVNGDIERYAPNQRYVVTLVGSRTHDVVQAFTRFKLTLAPHPAPADPTVPPPVKRLGQFQLFADTLSRFDQLCVNEVVESDDLPKTEVQLFADTLSRFDQLCVNAVVETDDLPKTEVQVMWKAPPAGSGCVTIKAMVMENATRWFAEDGQLSKILCEDTSLARSDCCACDDAHYKMVFEGLWSPQTHPKDFPTQALWLTHFSDVMGATHATNFSFWGEGQIATDGFRSLAEWGSVGLLERELKQRRSAGEGVRSVFKAPGLWHPRVNSNASASFAVDRKRHLVSVASMFGPSPDWVVGVSGLELCNKDCSWVQEKTIDLYPYDAGTDSGISYMSPNAETVPREKMYRITEMYPEDPRAPFYAPQGRMQPMARLYLTRDKLVTRACDEEVLQAQVTDDVDASHADNRPECATSDWSPFSPCSVSCGKGLRMRTREYRMPDKARMFSCEAQLVSKEMCVAALPECPNDVSNDVEPEGESPAEVGADAGVCAVSEWGDWSECSVTCGVGVETRRRHFQDRMGLKKCPLVKIEETRKCMQPPCTEADTEAADPSCPTTEWSAWSACSASCGAGQRVRTRLLLVPADRQRRCAANVTIMQQQPCEGQDCAMDMITAKRVCMEPAEAGPCRGGFQRWAFVAMKGMCVPFAYGGCRGNRNNFLTQQDCLSACSVVLGGTPQVDSAPPANTVSESTSPPNPNDCVVSPWGEWSRCSVSCGVGYQQRERTILSPGGPGGAPCPPRLTRRRRCARRCD